MTTAQQSHSERGPDGLPQSIADLLLAVEQQRDMSAQLAAQLLRQAAVVEQDLAAWTKLDHPAARSFGVSLIHAGDNYELTVLSWQPGDMSAIQAMAHAGWAAFRTFGEAEHAVFGTANGLLHTIERRTLASGSVVSVDCELIQQIGNVGKLPFVSLHLSGSPDNVENPEMPTRIFDLDESQIQVCSCGAHFLLPDSQITERRAGIRGDFPTWLRHNVELLSRLDRMQPLDGRPGLATREARLLSELNSVDTWRALRLELRMHLPRLDAQVQEQYIRSLSQELVSATRLLMLLHENGRFQPRVEVLELIGEIIAMLEDDDFIARIAGTDV